MTLKQQKEQNRPDGLKLPNHSDYIVTNDGRVWTELKLRYLRGMINSVGYPMVYLRDNNGNQRWHFIHRLVAQLYVDNPLNKPDVDHIDNNKLNANHTNLQWVTHKENIELSYTRDGRTAPKGKDHWAYGRTKEQYNPETLAKMSAKKMGEKHPKFKGHYKYDGKLFASCRALSEYLGTYPMKVYRMIKQELIEFIPIKLAV